MSACTFIAADTPLSEFRPSQEYPIHINLDNGTIYDGGADDNYFLNAFVNVGEYTEKEYGVSLEWRYTDGRASRIIEYIKNALDYTECVELWHVWLIDYYEFENRPFIHRKTVRQEDLTIDHIRELDNSSIWDIPDKMYPERPSFYCLKII